MSNIIETQKKLLSVIESRRKEIKEINSNTYKTSCSLLFMDGTRSNINTENNIKKLVLILSWLNILNDSYKTVSKELGVYEEEMTYDGYIYSNWKEDISLRISKLTVQIKKDQLKKLEEKLEVVLAPELKTEREMDRISKELENL